MKFIKEFVPYVIIFIVVVLIRSFIVTPIRVDGHSMDPTLQDGEILLLKKYQKNYERFSIVVVHYENSKLIKRIIGLPGEHIRYENNALYVNGVKVEENFIDTTTSYFDIKNMGYDTIPENYYFVVGDNRNNSTDSRIIGFIPKEDIYGVADFVLFPFTSFGKINWRKLEISSFLIMCNKVIISLIHKITFLNI